MLDLTEPDAPVPDAPRSTLRQEDFTPCPVEELRASYEALLPEGDAQAGFAIEEEVLRLCRERQALINEIIEAAAEFPALIGELRAANEAVAATPVVITVPETVEADDTVASDPVTLTLPAPAPQPELSVAPLPAQAVWDHRVRFIVRAGDGPWRARISSVRTPPPTVSSDAEGRRIIIPGTPEAPRLLTVSVDDELPDGGVVTAIEADRVVVRDAAGGAPRRLVSEPIPEGSGDAAAGFVYRRAEQ